MNFFKKKQKEKPKSVKIQPIDNWEWSTKAIEVEYNELIKNYELNPNETTARKLQYLSKKLNDRAYEQGNGKLYQEIKANLPQMKLTEESFNRMTNAEKENFKTVIKLQKETQKALEKLSEPEPQRVEFTMEVETPTTIKQDQTKQDTNVVIQKDDEEVVLINDVQVEPYKGHGQGAPPPPKKKKKIPGMDFFKKKKLIEEAQASVNLDHDPNLQTMSEPPKKQSIFNKPLFQKKEKTDGEQKLKGLFNKKDKKPKLPNLICPDCMHSINAHQSRKGESTGCKCGCLNTAEVILQRHNVTKQETPKEAQDDTILKQAQQMASMKSQPKPKQIKPPEPLTEPSTKQRSLCANCDHVPKAHFDGVGFCTVIGCTCEGYRAYPE